MSLRAVLAALAFLILFPVCVFAQEEEKRYALVVGNGSYEIGSLKNPINDARSMATVLQETGFAVSLLENVTAEEFQKGLDDFLQNIPAGSTALFYYAGHAFQSEGRNYLLPVDIKVSSVDQVKNNSVNAHDLIQQFNSAGAEFSIFIFDACRDNPFVAGGGEVGRGLASMESDGGETLIAFSTQSGEVAYDGFGSNSPYTGALVTEMDKPGADVLDVFRSVRRSVRIWTKGQQRPFISASIERNFYFRNTARPPLPDLDGEVSFDTIRAVVEQIWWATIQDSVNPDDFRAYVRQYPESENVETARSLAGKLEEQKVAVRGLELVQFSVDRDGPVNDVFRLAITACDVSAGDPDDPRRITDGVPWGLVNVRQAVRDCAEALAEDPTNPRLVHQIGRLMDIQGKYEEADSFYRLAATVDYSASLVNLGYLFSAGKGRERNFETALSLYQQAADLGNLRARTNIGVFYERGWGVQSDLTQAALWYNLAAQNGWPNALDTLANLHRKGQDDTGHGLPQNLREAVRLYRIASELGNTNAMNNLGNLYLSDKLGAPDVEEGLEWLERAVELGNRWAPHSLGKYYRDGRYVEKNPARAVELFRKGMDLGNVEARIALARLYVDGAGVEKDLNEAAFHFNVAALASDKRKPKVAEQALKRLGQLSLDDGARATALERAELWLRNNGN